MRSQKNRVEKLEDMAVQSARDIPKGLQAIYQREDERGSDVQQGLEIMYNSNQSF